MPVYYRETVIEPHKQSFYEHSQEEQVVVNKRPFNGHSASGPSPYLVPEQTFQYQSPGQAQYQSKIEQEKRIPQNQVRETHQTWYDGVSPQQQQIQQSSFQTQYQSKKPQQFVQKTPQFQNASYGGEQTTKVVKLCGQHPLEAQEKYHNEAAQPAINRYEERLKQQLSQYPYKTDDIDGFQFSTIQTTTKNAFPHEQQLNNGIFQKTIVYHTQEPSVATQDVRFKIPSLQTNINQVQTPLQVAVKKNQTLHKNQQREGQQEQPQIRFQLQQEQQPQQFQQRPQTQQQPQTQQKQQFQQHLQYQQQQPLLQQQQLQTQQQPQTQQQQFQQHLQYQQQQPLLQQQQLQEPQQQPQTQQKQQFQQQPQVQQQYMVFQSDRQNQPAKNEQEESDVYIRCESSAPGTEDITFSSDYPLDQQQFLPISGLLQQKQPRQQHKFQPPSPITQIDCDRTSSSYYKQNECQQLPEGFFKTWYAGERPEYYIDIPFGSPPTFTSQGTMEDKLFFDGEQYANKVGLAGRRAESEQRRRHHSPVPGASEHGYLFGGMDFIDHVNYDPNQSVEIFIDPDGLRRARAKSLDRGPPRRPNDLFGLDYSTISPSERARDYAFDDQQHTYRGYQAQKPKKQSKYSADMNIPLNIVEAENLDLMESDKLVGNTISNQKVIYDKDLDNEEKLKFCAEFAPGGFKQDHITIRPEPKPEEPICFSTSAKKPESCLKTIVNPFKSDIDSGWYMRDKEDKTAHVWDRQRIWEGQTQNLDARAWLPSWAKIPPPIPPPWVRRSNTVHNVWQTAADRGYVPPTDYNTKYQTMLGECKKGNENEQLPSQDSQNGDSQPIISTDNIILPETAQTPNLRILKKKTQMEKQEEPPIIVTRNPFAAVEPIFAREKKYTQVVYSPHASAQIGKADNKQSEFESIDENRGEGALV